MDSRLLKGMSNEEKMEFKALFSESRRVRTALVELLEAELDKSIKDLSGKDKFFLPAYSEYTAHMLGEQSALRATIKLLKGE